jgi:hypothetical protein
MPATAALAFQTNGPVRIAILAGLLSFGGVRLTCEP